MFFEYHQNNSGGVTDYDHKAGISVKVIVEADSADHANERARDIGLYFNGEGDCSCCGDRWYEQWNGSDGDPEPLVYGESVEDFVAKGDFWSNDVPEGTATVYVHYLTGQIQGYYK